MNNLTPAMIEKAKAVKSAEELLDIAKENHIEMTADEAATYFAQLNPKSGELEDDDLDSVAGGACNGSSSSTNQNLVRVINGKSCSGCGGTVGSLMLGSAGMGDRVYCNNCEQQIIIMDMGPEKIKLGVDYELI